MTEDQKQREFEGDAWRHTKYEEYTGRPRLTRAQEQRYIDRLYSSGRLTREEWMVRTEELGDPELWNSEGKIQ